MDRVRFDTEAHPVRTLMKRFGLTVLALGLVATLVLLSRPPPRRGASSLEPLFLPRASVLRAFGRPILPAIVDYYWLQSLQTLGGARTASEFRSLADYGNLISDLDSQFTYPNRFLGGAIPVDLGREQWVNTTESTELMQRALAFAPDDYQLRILLGFNLSYFHHRYEDAARLLEATSRIPGSPSFIRPLATRLYAHAGRFESAMMFAQSLAESAEDPAQRELFTRRMAEIQLERELQRVEAAAAAYRERTGTAPRDVSALVAQGFLSPPPIDPLGGTIFLDEKGVAHSTSEEHRLAPFVPNGT
jgi:hypothetical protein